MSTVRRYVAHTMGMPISLALRGRHAHDRAGLEAWTEAMAILLEVDRVFSTYRTDSFVSRLGRGEISLPDCPVEVAEVLALGVRAEQESDGAFSVRRRAGDDDRTTLDPSGVVKGWAVERAAAPLRALAETDFSLSAGGDLVCRTLDPASGPWRVGIEDPRDPTRLLGLVPVHNGAVATSGTAHRGSHLVDARTGLAPQGVASVTVVGPDLTWVDIDATAAYAQGANADAWLSGRSGRTGLVVWADGSTTLVSGSPPASDTASISRVPMPSPRQAGATHSASPGGSPSATVSLPAMPTTSPSARASSQGSKANRVSQLVPVSRTASQKRTGAASSSERRAHNKVSRTSTHSAGVARQTST